MIRAMRARPHDASVRRPEVDRRQQGDPWGPVPVALKEFPHALIFVDIGRRGRVMRPGNIPCSLEADCVADHVGLEL